MSAVVVLIVFAVLAIVGRELITWYFKINKIEEVLREILEEIKEKRVQDKQES
jgi:cell division protein FtsB